jgi:hypothetical protein
MRRTGKIRRRNTSRLGRCFGALFGIPFWALSLVDLKTPAGFVNVVRVG